ncbi:hypothetical protein [Streptomyces sp. NPDC046976]
MHLPTVGQRIVFPHAGAEGDLAAAEAKRAEEAVPGQQVTRVDLETL